MKRAFVRRGEQLEDTSVDEDGTKTLATLTERGAISMFDHSGMEFVAEPVPHAQQSREELPSLEQLLSLLGMFDPSVPAALERHVGDPRVRAALADATREVPAPQLARFACVLGRVGGPTARAVLAARRAELLSDERTFEEMPGDNSRASSLVAVAAAELSLDADASEAADVLLRLMEHPCERQQVEALGVAQVFGRPDVHTEAFERVRVALRPRMTPETPLAFMAAARALSALEPGFVLERCNALLEHNAKGRRMAMWILQERGTDPRAFSALRRHLPREPSPARRVELASMLGSLAPSEERAEAARMGLEDASPYCRLQALQLLKRLGPSVRRDIAHAALADEPDPLLQRLLRQLVATAVA